MDEKLKLSDGLTDEELKLPADRNYWQIAFAAIAILGSLVLMVYFFAFAVPSPSTARPIVTPGEPTVIEVGIAAPKSAVIVRQPPSLAKLGTKALAVTEAVFHLGLPLKEHDGSYRSAGSGFLVAPDTVATAAHVIPDGHDGAILVFCVKRDDGLMGAVEGRVLDVDAERDVALLSVDGCEDAEPVTLAKAAPGPNEALNALGYSSAAEIGTGVVDADHTTCSFIPGANLAKGSATQVLAGSWDALVAPNLVGITGVVEFGNSGGAVFRNSDGAVVGLISARDSYLARSFMAPAASIRELLERNGR